MSLLDFYYHATSVASEVAEVKKNFFFLNLTYRWTLFVKTIFWFRKSVSPLYDYTTTEGLLNSFSATIAICNNCTIGVTLLWPNYRKFTVCLGLVQTNNSWSQLTKIKSMQCIEIFLLYDKCASWVVNLNINIMHCAY